MKNTIFVDILNRKQKIQLNLLMGCWLLATIGFYVWWCQSMVDPVEFAFNTALISLPLLVPAYPLFFIRRMKKPNIALGIPKEWRVAMIVTKAPSEPWSVVRNTLTGVLNENSFPHDTWLADEDPSEETKQWCAEKGIKISCRKGIPEYNNLDYPRRTRCKEGNLAWFFDNWGYQNYDFITQFDSDHKPEPGYLANALVAFHDPKVGLVTAPSICDANEKTSWSARGRLYSEGAQHGPVQAGMHTSFSALAIGSHFTMRTTALKEIGGLGPELAEDHSTSVLMNAHGWKVVHSIDSIAHGRGPESLRDALIQELQWSRSVVIIFLTLTTKLLGKFKPLMALQFLFSEFWYIIFATMMPALLLIAPAVVIAGHPFVEVNFWAFLIASSTPVVFLVLVMEWLRHQKLLRPVQTRVINWESILFNMARWPIILFAHYEAVNFTYFQHRRFWKVTPKKKEDGNSIPAKFWMPYVGIVAIILAVQFFFASNDDTECFSFFNLLNAITYGALLILIHVLHKREAKTLKALQLKALHE